MNLYSNKLKWKIALLIMAIVLVAFSLLFTNRIVGRVGLREKERVAQWADVIRKKAELINLTNLTFDELRERERQKAELWASATRELIRPSEENIDITFPLGIVQDNEDIPLILVNSENKVINQKNIGFDMSTLSQIHEGASTKELQGIFNDSLVVLSEIWAQTHKPLEIEIYKGEFQRIYYFDSKKLTELEFLRDSLIASFNRELIDKATMVPVIFMDEEASVLIETNIDSLKKYKNQLLPNAPQLKVKMVDSLNIVLAKDEVGKIYFDDSEELKQLRLYPYLQFVLIGLFIFIGYVIFSTFRKAEQNQVWAGMAKETAHQLGTPISSLMAWIQLLESNGHPNDQIEEMNKDIDRLTTIADRFEKIGSGSKVGPNDLKATLSKSFNYLRTRLSNKVEFNLHLPEHELIAMHNPALMEWVIENICKNAVDAMDGKGQLDINIEETTRMIHIDIADNGKGIPANKLKTVFEPGYTTKKRGWGLGLSLVKRIVNTYHKGKVFVLHSEVGKGTTFRVSLLRP